MSRFKGFKLDKRSVVANYRPAELPGRNCHRCVFVRIHGNVGRCVLVKGPVDSEHVCSLFVRKP